jgi:uncharacterized protein (TIGR03437 family)
MRLMVRFVAGVVLCFLMTPDSPAQTNDPGFYDFGNPTVKDIWVDANNGNDANSGDARGQALRTVTAAWDRIPRETPLVGTGYRIRLAAGVYPASAIPGYWASRYGTLQCPVIIQSEDGPGAAVIAAFMNIFDCRYLYLLDLKIAPEPADTAIHLEQCDHTVMRGLVMDGKRAAPQVLKVNHCEYIYLENSEVFNAVGSAVDFVAVRYGRLIANRVHDAGNWGILVKGGSAYFHIEANEIYNAVRGGFSAGQTTGFEFLQSPWLHYEAYDVKFVNNLVHDTGNGGMAVEGGYNVLFAYNTLYRLGGDGSMFEVLHGIRVCSADTAKCAKYLTDGGWGTAGAAPQPIPNRNVFVYNNVLYNPPGFETRSSHFSIFGPQTAAADSNIPSPVLLDRNLQIRGNVIWNGGAGKAIGTESGGVGCQPSNPTCNTAQLRADNAINTVEPQFVNPAGGDFRPRPGGNLFNAKTYAVPNFDWSDAPQRPLAPAGNLDNAVARDRNNLAREAGSPPGAHTLPVVTTVSAANYKPAITPESLASAFGTNLAPKTATATSSPLPTVLEGTFVTVRDSAGASRPAPLFLVSPTQVNYLIPAGSAAGLAAVTIENWNGSLASGALQIVAVAPGLFSADASGKGLAAASVLRIRADGSQRYEPVARFDPAQNRIVAVPIEFGDAGDQLFLILYGTGFRNRSALGAVSVKIGGVDSQVVFAGAQGQLVGLDQANVRLARSLAGRGEVEVEFLADGQMANPVRIHIR